MSKNLLTQPVSNSLPQVYHLKNISARAQAVGVFVVLFIPVLFILVAAALQIHGLVILGGLVLVGVGVIYLYKNVLPQRMIVTFPAGAMEVKYTSKPFFDNVHDRTIWPADIAWYEVVDHRLESITLYLRDGTKWGAVRAVLDQGNDLPKVRELILAMIAINNAGGNSFEQIGRKDNVYEGKRGLRLAIFFIVMIVLMLIGIFFFQDQHKTKDVVYGVGYILIMLSYVLYILKLRRQRSKKNEGS